MKHSLKPRGRVNARRRPSRRLQLEALEARLPLGDALLSTLLGSSLMASSLSRDGPGSWASEGALNDGLQGNHHPAHRGTGSVLETNTPGNAPIASRAPFGLQGEGSEAQSSNDGTSAVHVVANRDSDAFRWSSNGSLFGTRDDLASDLTGDPLGGSVLSWDAAAAPTRHHLAGSSAEEGGSPGGGRTGLAAPLLAPQNDTGDLRAAQPPAAGAGATSGPSGVDLIGEPSSGSKSGRKGPTTPNAYVMNGDSNNVSVIDTGSNTVIDTVAVGMRPLRAAITPDGASVYLVNFLSNSVSVIETAHNTVVDTISVGTGPQAIAMTPDGAFAYAVNNTSNNVSVIDTAHNSVVDTIDVGTRPVGIAITPDGAFAYVANTGSASISVIETGHNTVVDTIAVGPGPFTLAITPDGAFAYVTQAGSVGDPGTTVTVVETTSHKVVQSIEVGQFPVGVAITPDGAFAYVANQGSTKDDTDLSVIETATNTVVKTVEVGHNPIGVAITDDGAFVYVTNSGAPFGQPARFPGTVSVIDTTDNTVVATVDVGTRPAGVAIMPSQAQRVHALFDLSTPTTGPFPSNWFTVGDRTQNTGKRVNLPLPDCQTHPSDCEDVNVLNTLDGFNLQPRLSIPFDGPIDVNSVSSNTVFLVSLGDTLNHHDHGGQVVGINQVVWDVATTTLHVESDELLAQHTRYALIVTNGLHDTGGAPVEATRAFRHFRQDVRGPYRHELLDAIHAARRVGVRERDIVTASVFTTMSATAVLEKIRDQIHAATPAPADFLLGPGRSRTVFARNEVTGIRWDQQIGDDPPRFNPVQVDLALLDVIPGAVSRIAFGKYLSPDYEVHPGEYIPPVRTRTGTPVVQGHNEIYFNLFLPSGARPEAGWPVAIFGHGLSNNKQGSPLLNAASMAAQGIATIAINVVGHGFGPLGTLTVDQTVGGPVTFSAGGRGFDQNGDHIIGATSGINATAPRTILGNTDGNRQTVVDLMQLVRVIQVGIDVDGNGVRDIDPSRIYCSGQSVGAQYGTDFLAVEPDVGAGVLNVAGGSFWETIVLGPGNRAGAARPLAARVPSLINSPGITMLGGVPVASAPYFNENMPLRNGIPLAVRLEDGTDHIIQSPVLNDVVGAMEIQEVLENRLWVNQSANPVAYAPHLRKNPLAGVPAKSVIIQFATGDQTVQNPTTTALLRAGDLADRATRYRHDLAFAKRPALPTNPHPFLNGITNPDWADIALGAQEQIATFLASDGKIIIHPEPARFFETPIKGPLPEDLNFIP